MEEEHQLKFGGYIDLQSLDAVQPSEAQKEAELKLAEQEKICSKRIQKEEEIYKRTKREALEKKKENTRIIVEITGFGEK